MPENSLGCRSAPYAALPKVLPPRPTWLAIGDKLQFPVGNLGRLPKGSGPEFPIWPLDSFEVSMPQWRKLAGALDSKSGDRKVVKVLRFCLSKEDTAGP